MYICGWDSILSSPRRRSALERRRNNSKRFKGVYLNAKARIWP